MEAARNTNVIDADLGFTDIILPAQYFGAMGSARLCSEQRLMLAVLVDAINILQGWQRLGSARKRRAFAEAAQWVNTRGTGFPFSFDSICDALNIDSEVLRHRLSGLTMGYTGASARLGVGRLRLKESSRAQHMTANRVRRRRRTRLAVVPA
jgi:hypothetical protein